MGDRQRNLAQFQASLNPFQGGSDRSRVGDGNSSAAAGLPAAAAAAAVAMGNPALWELNRAMQYNNFQQQQQQQQQQAAAAVAAAAFGGSGGSGASGGSNSWASSHQFHQGQGEAVGRYYGSNFDGGAGGSDGGPAPPITRRIPSKGETKATPPLPPSLSPHQLGNDVYRSFFAHHYDKYMAAAIAANMPHHQPSPSPPAHRPGLPQSSSSGSHSSAVPPPRFSPQQQQTAALLAAVAAASSSNNNIDTPQTSVNGGERCIGLPQISPSGIRGINPPRSPSPPAHSGGESSDADERVRHRRKQDQPRRQTVIYAPGTSPPPPSEDSGGSYCSPPPQHPIPSTPSPLPHDVSPVVRSHQSDMPISQAMSHALAHPFLAAHLNPPTTPPSHTSPRNSPINSRFPQSHGTQSSPHKTSLAKPDISPHHDTTKTISRSPLIDNNVLATRDSPHLSSSHNSPHLVNSHNSPHNASPHLQSTHNSPHLLNNSPHVLASRNSPRVHSNSPHIEADQALPHAERFSSSSTSINPHNNTHTSDALLQESRPMDVQSPHTDQSHPSPPLLSSNNSSCYTAHRGSTASPLPRPGSENSRHSDQSMGSDPSRNSDLSRMELSRLHSPLPPSPVQAVSHPRSTYNGPLPQAAATAREVPVDVGSGPSRHYDTIDEDPLSDIQYSGSTKHYGSSYYGSGDASAPAFSNDNFNSSNCGLSSSSTTMTPAQKKSLSPLKTINLAALDNFYQDDISNNSTSLPTAAAEVSKRQAPTSNTNAFNYDAMKEASARQSLSPAISSNVAEKKNSTDNSHGKSNLTGDSRSVQSKRTSSRSATEHVDNSDNKSEKDSGVSKSSNVSDSDKCGSVISESLKEKTSNVINSKSLNGVVNNSIPNNDKVESCMNNNLSSSISDNTEKNAFVNGDHNPASPKKNKKSKSKVQPVLPLENIEGDCDNKRRTRQRRAVSYVEDGTDPVLEMNEDGGALASPPPSGITSPTKRRGRKSKSSTADTDGMLDALSPSSTATSGSLRDNLSPDRDLDALNATPIVSPGGRGRGSRGRGRGRGRGAHVSTNVISAVNNNDSNHPDDQQTVLLTHSDPSTECGEVYEFSDLGDMAATESTVGRGKRGGKRGRKRGSPNKRGRGGSRRCSMSSPPPVVDSLLCENAVADVHASDPVPQKPTSPDNKDTTNVSENKETPQQEVSKNDKPKSNFPFLTVKDPSVLLEKYSGKDDEDSSLGESDVTRPFQGITDISQCLINSQFDSKDGDSSGDGFSPSNKLDDVDKIGSQLMEVDCQKDDEAPPSIAYIPRMGRNRDVAMASRNVDRSREKSAIEQVLLTLNENIASMDTPNTQATHPESNSVPVSLPSSLGISATSTVSEASYSNKVVSSAVPCSTSESASTLPPAILPSETQLPASISNAVSTGASITTGSITITPIVSHPTGTNISVLDKISKQATESSIPINNNTQAPNAKSKTVENTNLSEKSSTCNIDKAKMTSNTITNTTTDKNVSTAKSTLEELSKKGLSNVVASTEQNVYVMSIAETVMSGSPRSAARRGSGRNSTDSNNGSTSAGSSQDKSSKGATGFTPENSSVASTVGSSNSTRGRRSSRRSSHRNEPEVVQVEVHPEPQSASHSGENSPSVSSDNNKTVSSEDTSGARGPSNCIISSSLNNCAKTRDRVPSNNQDDMDDITVVPDVQPTIELRPRNPESRGMCRVTTPLSSKSNSKNFRAGSSASSTKRALNADRSTKPISKTSKSTFNKKLKLSEESSPSNVSASSSNDGVSAVEDDTVMPTAIRESHSQDLKVVRDSSGTPVNDTDSETLENIALFLKDDQELQQQSSSNDLKTSTEDSKTCEISKGAECSTSNLANEPEPSCSYKSEPAASGSGKNAGPASSRPKRTPRPPQSEEQINEVLMLLNMEDEESEDEDYVPKDASDDSDAATDDDSSSTEEGSDSSDDDDESDGNNSKTSSLGALLEKASANESCSGGGKKTSQTKGKKKSTSSKSRSKNNKKGKQSTSKKNKNKSFEEPEPKRKKGNDGKRIVPDDGLVEYSPYIQLVPESNEEYINNEPQEQSSYEQPIPKSSTIPFFVEGESKQRNSKVGFNSTLHNNYNAFSKDLTWFCSLCKQFSHSYSLGDLFGPLFIDGLVLLKKQYPPIIDGQALYDSCDGLSGGASGSARGKGKRTHRVEPHTSHPADKRNRVGSHGGIERHHSVDSNSSTSGGGTITAADLPPGGVTVGPGPCTNLPSSSNGPPPDASRGTECWLHESCLVWLPGISVVNSKLCGLEGAITLAQENICVICNETGASIGCLRNGCPSMVHFSCGQQNHWTLNCDTFMSYCGKHAPTATPTTPYLTTGTSSVPSTSAAATDSGKPPSMS